VKIEAVVREKGVKEEGVTIEGVKMELVNRQGVKNEDDDEQRDERAVTGAKPENAVKLETGTTQQPLKLENHPSSSSDDVKVKTEDLDGPEHVPQLPTSPQVKTEDTTYY